jgi:copper(I)-binding protein
MYRVLLALSGLLLGSAALAQNVQVRDAWARATVPGQDTGMVNLTLRSQQAGELIAVSSPVCQSVEMHSMAQQDGMMQMREVHAIALPAGTAVNLEQQGYHLMLVGLKHSLKTGGKIPLSLSIKLGGLSTTKIKTHATIRPLADQGAPHDSEHEHHHEHRAAH